MGRGVLRTLFAFIDKMVFEKQGTQHKMKKLIFTTLLIVLQPVLVGCSNSSSEWIQGTWKTSDSSLGVQFNSDGTFGLGLGEDAKVGDKVDDFSGTYATEGNQLTMTFDPEQDFYGTLTMTIIDKEASSFRVVDLKRIDSKSSGDSEPSPLITRIE